MLAERSTDMQKLSASYPASYPAAYPAAYPGFSPAAEEPGYEAKIIIIIDKMNVLSETERNYTERN